MPMPKDFAKRLLPILPKVISEFGTPFHIFDETGIIEGGRRLIKAFTNSGLPDFREFFAVKACPIPAVLGLMRELGFGFDCSSIPEILLAERMGARQNDLMFTSNDTSREELAFATDHQCILNLDDLDLIRKVPNFPKLICFRYNPGARRTGNAIIGNPIDSKYGVTHEQIANAYILATGAGARRYGLHTMVCSNELNYGYMVETVRMLLGIIKTISQELKIHFDFINMGGGLGIPYRPTDTEIPIETLAQEIGALFCKFGEDIGYLPRLYMESGRWVTGPHGVLVTKVINEKHTYHEFRGVDACCLASAPRPAFYKAYHHITVVGKNTGPTQKVRVVGPACENWDQFTWDTERELPVITEGDHLIVHDTGAHCLAMRLNYNGRLAPKALMLGRDGQVRLIQRAETLQDYFATFIFEPTII